MKPFSTSAVIKATPETIWQILTDAPNYPNWNRTVARVTGSIALGQIVTVHVSGGSARAFSVKVVQFEAPARMVWSQSMPLGAFKGERTYVLRSLAGDNTEFSMREEYTGFMAPLITKSIPDLQPAFDEFAACLKTYAELEHNAKNNRMRAKP